MSLTEPLHCPFCNAVMESALARNGDRYRYVCDAEHCRFYSPIAETLEAAARLVRRLIVKLPPPEPRPKTVLWVSLRDRKPPDRGQDYYYLAIVDGEWEIIPAGEVVERATWWAEKEPASP